jgi:hypothetical protein
MRRSSPRRSRPPLTRSQAPEPHGASVAARAIQPLASGTLPASGPCGRPAGPARISPRTAWRLRRMTPARADLPGPGPWTGPSPWRLSGIFPLRLERLRERDGAKGSTSLEREKATDREASDRRDGIGAMPSLGARGSGRDPPGGSGKGSGGQAWPPRPRPH